MRLEFFLQGKVRGKERPRFAKGGYAYTPNNTREYEEKVKNAYRLHFGDTKIQGNVPLKLELEIGMLIPKSRPTKEKEMLLQNKYAVKKPDIDNIEKIVTDALNEVAYEDDVQICVVIKSRYWVLTESEEGVKIIIEVI
jgi:Holliday junction resolvase RusA-like endonuclease